MVTKLKEKYKITYNDKAKSYFTVDIRILIYIIVLGGYQMILKRTKLFLQLIKDHLPMTISGNI